MGTRSDDGARNAADGRFRRSSAVKLAAAGAAGALGAGMVSAKSAEATNGAAVTAGGVTTAEGRTSVRYDGSSGFQGVVLLGHDSTYDGGGANFPAGVGGWAGAGSTAGSGGVTNGVYGYTDNGNGNGVVGYNSGLVTGAGAGVLGLAFTASNIAVDGRNTLGTAVSGSSGSTAANATAIVGTISSTSPGSFSVGVRGVNGGTGGLGIGVWGSHAGGGWGVYGQSASGIGVIGGGGTGTGVEGSGATGVFATGTTIGLKATGPTAIEATGADAAITASAGSSAAAVQIANTGSGPALQVTGPALFSRSGRATVSGSTATPKSTAKVKNVALTDDSIVLATIQGNHEAVAVSGVDTNPANGQFTIHLNKAVTEHVSVAWFVVN